MLSRYSVLQFASTIPLCPSPLAFFPSFFLISLFLLFFLPNFFISFFSFFFLSFYIFFRWLAWLTMLMSNNHSEKWRPVLTHAPFPAKTSFVIITCKYKQLGNRAKRVRDLYTEWQVDILAFACFGSAVPSTTASPVSLRKSSFWNLWLGKVYVYLYVYIIERFLDLIGIIERSLAFRSGLIIKK